MRNIKIYMRKANKLDIIDLWKWRNDKVTRRNSLNTKIIPFKEHQRWFKRSLKNSKCKIYIFETDSDKVGMVRFDFVTQKLAEISININPVFRGKGFGKTILKKAVNFIKRNYKNCIQKASIKFSNRASEKIFSNAKFIKIHDVKELKYSVWIKI